MNTNDTTKWNVSDILKKFTQEQSAKLQEEQLKEQLKQSMMAQQAQQLSQFVPGMASENVEPEFDQYAQGYRQGGIKLDPAKKGTFKAQATRMGMSVQEAARHILSNKEKYSPGMVKKANFARNFAKEEGGTIDNAGFNALPEYVQNKILDNMEYGGDMDQYGRGGYTVRRSNDRKGKTHVVTGPDGTKKYFGDPNMGERSKSKNGKDAFYARHATNLKNNPYFRAYARATWEDGGEINDYARGGEMIKRADGSYSQRGLWDNIRANAGSGKEPTAEMLEQERKISKRAEGGETCPEGTYWDENLQTCVPQVDAEAFFKDWYSKRTLPFDEIGNKTYENAMRKILPMYNPDSTLLQTITDNSVPYEFQSMIADTPGVLGELVYNKKTWEPEKILLKESLKDNPTELNKTIVSEESTRIRDPYNNKMLPAEQLILNNAIKTYEEGWGDMKKGPEEEAAYNMYNYITDPKQDNIQSALFEVRYAKNLKPGQVITEQDIENWRKEAEESGALDMTSPNFDDSLYKLFKLSKDNKSMTELFNYIASTNDGNTSNSDVAYARYGGDFGYLPNFF